MSSQKMVRRNEVDASESVAAKRPRACSQATKITDLNDDCLLEIYPYLSLVDLWVMKKTDQRFIETVDRAFKNEYLERDGSFYYCSETVQSRSYDESEQIVEVFGDVITKVRMSLEKETHRIFALLNHCSAMEELNLFLCRFTHIPNDLNIRRFENLRRLTIEGCSGSEANFKLIFNACDPLKLFHLSFDTGNMSDDILAFIADRMVHLEYFSFGVHKRSPSFHENVSKLQNLQKLKSVRMNCENVLVTPLIDALANIESLQSLRIHDFSEIIPDENFVEAINNLSNVRTVEYTHNHPILTVGKITNFRLTKYNNSKFHEYKFQAMN